MSVQLAELGLNVESVDAIKNRDLVEKYSVMAVPTLVKVDEEGNEIARLRGAQTAEKLKEFFGDEHDATV
jgi:thioredoxin-related protein